MDKRRAMPRCLDYFIADIRSTDHEGFYDDDDGEAFGDKDRDRLDRARDALCWQLIGRARRLERNLDSRQSRAAAPGEGE